MPELDERKRIIDYDTVNDPDENYYVLADNGTEGTGKVNVKKIGPGNMISDAYSDQDTYAVGDICIHNNILYVCNTEIDTPHAFDLSEWDPDTLGNYCSKLNGDVTEIKSSLSQKATRHWTMLGTVTATGILTLSHAVTDYAEVLICLQYPYPSSRKIRQSLVAPIDDFINEILFPDFIIANVRTYFGYSYTDSTHINVTSFEKGSLSGVGFTIYGR